MQPSPRDLGREVEGWNPDRLLIAGGSLIVGPLGDVLAGLAGPEPALLAADVDLGEVVRARFDLDVMGHYARPDVFQLTVHETPRPGVVRRRGVE